MFDEPSSYLDVKQRLNAAQTIRGLLANNRSVSFICVHSSLFNAHFGHYGIITNYLVLVFETTCLHIFNHYFQRYIIVVEHDLSVLDYLSDYICCLYGTPGAYGVVTMPFSVREGKAFFGGHPFHKGSTLGTGYIQWLTNLC